MDCGEGSWMSWTLIIKFADADFWTYWGLAWVRLFMLSQVVWLTFEGVPWVMSISETACSLVLLPSFSVVSLRWYSLLPRSLQVWHLLLQSLYLWWAAFCWWCRLGCLAWLFVQLCSLNFRSDVNRWCSARAALSWCLVNKAASHQKFNCKTRCLTFAIFGYNLILQTALQTFLLNFLEDCAVKSTTRTRENCCQALRVIAVPA